MTNETLRALRGSIAKWQKILDGTGIDRCDLNCPLCEMYGTRPECGNCPVKRRVGTSGCVSTPWEGWSDHHYLVHPTRGARVLCPRCKDLAQQELNFLKSLLPKRKKPGRVIALVSKEKP